MVLDSAVTLMGSLNWTRGTARNSEDLNLVSSKAVAAACTAHWRERLAVWSVTIGARTGAGSRRRQRADAPEPPLFPTPTSAEAVQGDNPRPGGLR
jgi:hypothetical protein